MNARRTLTILAVLLAAAQWAGAAGTINPVQEYIMSTFASAAQGGSGKLDYHTVTNVETKLRGQRALLRFDGPQWVFTNSWSVATNVDVSIDAGTRISVGTNAILTFNSNWVDWSRQGIFNGLGTVTGAVRCNVSYHPVWSNTVSRYYLTGGTLNDTNIYLTTLTVFTGDVAGVWNDLQLQDGVVESNHIANGNIHSNHLGFDIPGFINSFIASTNAMVLFRVSKSDAGGAQSMSNRLQLYKTTFDTINADVDFYGNGGWTLPCSVSRLP